MMRRAHLPVPSQPFSRYSPVQRGNPGQGSWSAVGGAASDSARNLIASTFNDIREHGGATNVVTVEKLVDAT